MSDPAGPGDLAALRAALALEGNGAGPGDARAPGAGSGPDELEPLPEQDRCDDDRCVVARTRDGRIVRLALDAADAAREAALVRLLADRLLVELPQDVRTGQVAPVVVHRALDGAAFDPDAYAGADGRTRNRLAASIARLLVVWHSVVGVDEAAELGVPRVDPDELAAQVAAGLDRLPAALRGRAEDVVAHFGEAWLAEPRPAREVLLHGGLHPGVLRFAGPVGEVVAVRDLSHARIGPPSLDLRLLARLPSGASPGLCRDLMQRVADQYARTGVVLDVDGARAAMAMADLATAIRTGDLRHFEPDDGVWAWPGADRG